jgi:hypothetical protein
MEIKELISVGRKLYLFEKGFFTATIEEPTLTSFD